MSTLTVTNIKATGETASRAVSGVAAAWVNFNGSGTVAIRDSVNITSVADAGTGKYGINYTNSFSSANDYVMNGGINQEPSPSRGIAGLCVAVADVAGGAVQSQAAGSISTRHAIGSTSTTNGGLYDTQAGYASFYGDLA